MTAPAGPAALVIEPVTAGDDATLDRVAAIEAASFPRPWGRAALAAELTRAWARLAVARVGGEVVGFVDFWVVCDEIQLLAIAADPVHRRAGVGAALLRHVLAAGPGVVTLEVRRGNAAAIALYQAHGFRTLLVRSAYYGDNGEDALVMVWSPGDRGSTAG
ncbi:MAG: ribosomal protein S18-alanine N-acetyltransferase [Kofleriaceae bacterium]|nr:ribosomal protein S18-alanine N-acetyltransferase [Kofleriaceae bacterium]MBP6835856.1 ribosomal protein S18-alanine N-acetyltransferase [Kofleriaceae bacterium]MBP9202575.1 ribosomal protein S18-alanine N-acetyltransferase [Kofleriaceae bacterium]